MEQEQISKKKVIGEALKRLGIIGEKETGQVIVHLNEGGVTKVVKQSEVK
jgi:hypothetical protein